MALEAGVRDAATWTMHWRSEIMQPDGAAPPMRMTEVFQGDRRALEIAQVGPGTGKEVVRVSMISTRRPEPDRRAE